jgi:hypothetical protein
MRATKVKVEKFPDGTRTVTIEGLSREDFINLSLFLRSGADFFKTTPIDQFGIIRASNKVRQAG